MNLKHLKAVPITPESFRPFGQLISPIDDGRQGEGEEAQLDLSAGLPRFYIMRLKERGLRFHRITYHAKVTQCLGALSPQAHWYMAVARPTGSLERPPQEEDLTAFKIPHGVYVKLDKGTWHAGPLFAGHEHMDFYNLELHDTNEIDHSTHDYLEHDMCEFQVDDAT